ncbi:MAG: phenylalanine 4-monooxygenase [Myxococcota bacterium]
MHGLVELDADHPGFRDPEYRRRRHTIAAIANAHVEGTPVLLVAYTADEQRVWRAVCDHLRPLHEAHLHPELQATQRRLELLDHDLPQLEDVNQVLEETGFRMEPVAGLVTARDFLEALGRGTFMSTQYLRHGSRPLYTPEPDLVHELVGHAASLLHPGIAAVSRSFGEAAARADDREIEALVRIYWWTLEFGLVRHDGALKAIGAGLLSSAGELAGAVDETSAHPVLQAWDVGLMAATDYDPTQPNPGLFVAPSLEHFIGDLCGWLTRRRAA